MLNKIEASAVDAVDEVKESEVVRKAREAKRAARRLAVASTNVKNEALAQIAQALEANEDAILAANGSDVERARASGVNEARLDRLTLTRERLRSIAASVREVIDLDDPVGRALRSWRQPNGLEIAQVRVPLGVVGIIYEARPNVTVDAAALCLKAGNAALLRGSSDAIESNKAIAAVLQKAIASAGLPEASVQLIENTERSAAQEMMTLNGLIDVLIPRGGAGLIQAVVSNATVPVIETGVGNCHVYVRADADLDKAEQIVINAKTKRPSVCCAMETLLVDLDVAEAFLPRIGKALKEAGVEIRGCERTQGYIQGIEPASDDDWREEYLDLILAVKVVDGIDEAIDHIEEYGSHHSDAIVTESYSAARRFVNEVDSAAVYVNASTYFTDGNQFGFGAEIGISTQKLHARGPMGLSELTSTKYIVYGDGHIRS